MAFIEWTEALSVKIAIIDRQHQKLVSMINELSDAMKQGKGKETLGRILNGLIAYTTTHFKTEEDYFQQYGYPETDSHKREHDAFVKKVSEFKAGFESGKLSVTIETMNFLRDWLKNHILGTDQKYSQFLNEKGLK